MSAMTAKRQEIVGKDQDGRDVYADKSVVVPGSLRPDGTRRKDLRVRAEQRPDGSWRSFVPQDEVKRAYKRLSLKFHPDRNRDDPNTTAKFQEISTAYNVLSSPRKRQIYDAYGEQGLKMYDSYMSFADSDDDSSKMPLQPVTMLLMVCVGISVLIFMSAAFGMLLRLYLSGSISPPLAVVFHARHVRRCRGWGWRRRVWRWQMRGRQQ